MCQFLGHRADVQTGNHKQKLQTGSTDGKWNLEGYVCAVHTTASRRVTARLQQINRPRTRARMLDLGSEILACRYSCTDQKSDVQVHTRRIRKSVCTNIRDSRNPVCKNTRDLGKIWCAGTHAQIRNLVCRYTPKDSEEKSGHDSVPKFHIHRAQTIATVWNIEENVHGA
jgi:hypothetical protein